MGFLQDLAGAFSGKSARNDVAAGKAEATALSNQGLAEGTQDYARAASRFDPFADYADTGYQTSQAGADLSRRYADRYADATGVNGRDAQGRVQAEYMSDPIQNALMDRITRANTRAAVASGMNNSGAATQSLTNALLSRWDAYTQSLKTGVDMGAQLGAQGTQMGSLGLQGAAGAAGMDQAIGDARISTASQNAGIATGAANATAGTRAAPLNNLLNIASVGVQAYTGKPATRNGTA